MKYIFKPIIFIWDAISLFFGFPYEKLATKLDLNGMDPSIRGPENKKTPHTTFRPNKVSK